MSILAKDIHLINISLFFFVFCFFFVLFFFYKHFFINLLIITLLTEKKDTVHYLQKWCSRTQNSKIQNIYSTLLQGEKKRDYLQDVLKGRSIFTQEVFF